MTGSVISSAQCRAARALLSWTQAALGREAAVARKTVADFELGNRRLHRRTLNSLRRALEAAGVEFLAECPEAGEGVRRRGAVAGPSRIGPGEPPSPTSSA